MTCSCGCRAAIAKALRAAPALTVRELVLMAHPSWTAEEIDREADQILSEGNGS